MEMGTKIILTISIETSHSLIDWNNPAIINKMYKVYLGDIPLKTKEVSYFALVSHQHNKHCVDINCFFPLLKTKLNPCFMKC